MLKFACRVLVIGLPCLATTAFAQVIPREAWQYRSALTRNARMVWGLDAPVATFAAQLDQESHWRSDAVSPVGARGMAQFMPGTARWMSSIDPALALTSSPSPRTRERSSNLPSPPAPLPLERGVDNPAWAMRALVTYDRWLWDRITASDDCQRMAKTLSAYNGGLGWLQRDERLARLEKAAPGKGPGVADLSLRWFDGVERFNSGRSAASFRENRAYPYRILRVREPVYRDAGWGAGSC